MARHVPWDVERIRKFPRKNKLGTLAARLPVKCACAGRDTGSIGMAATQRYRHLAMETCKKVDRSATSKCSAAIPIHFFYKSQTQGNIYRIKRLLVNVSFVISRTSTLFYSYKL